MESNFVHCLPEKVLIWKGLSDCAAVKAYIWEKVRAIWDCGLCEDILGFECQGGMLRCLKGNKCALITQNICLVADSLYQCPSKSARNRSVADPTLFIL